MIDVTRNRDEENLSDEFARIMAAVVCFVYPFVVSSTERLVAFVAPLNRSRVANAAGAAFFSGPEDSGAVFLRRPLLFSISFRRSARWSYGRTLFVVAASRGRPDSNRSTQRSS
jgi:hypothetical protein